jgi:hypothetical protein
MGSVDASGAEGPYEAGGDGNDFLNSTGTYRTEFHGLRFVERGKMFYCLFPAKCLV